jgi:hypothetical protein
MIPPVHAFARVQEESDKHRAAPRRLPPFYRSIKHILYLPGQELDTKCIRNAEPSTHHYRCVAYDIRHVKYALKLDALLVRRVSCFPSRGFASTCNGFNE